MADAFSKNPPRPAPKTSDRHTDILNGYKTGGSRFNVWAQEKLGDIRILEWAHGRVSLRWEIDDRFVMPDGVMFGGHVASVADHVAGLVTMSVLEDGADRFRTSRLETNFFRPVMKPFVTIEARLVNAAKTLIHVEAEILNPEGKRAVKIAATQVLRKAG